MELVLDWVEIASLVVAILGIPAAAVGVLTYRKAKQAQNLVRATANFGHVHEYVRMHQRELRSASWSATPAHHRSRDVELLAQPGWIPDKPIPLSGVTLEWIPRRSGSTTVSHGAEAVESAARRSPYGGLSYSSALAKQVDTSSLFNGFVYRPLAIEPTTPGLRIAFTEGRYFDYLDQSEFLAHELGAQLLAGKAPSGGRYRSYISNPFDLEKRSTSLGINTLTIRKSAHGNHGFFMHRRGGRRLVNESELLHVVPAGEFAPSNIAPESRPADFDIFRTILRVCRRVSEPAGG
jgi:hypothetical protein